MERILVMEDDESIRIELMILLRAHGYLPVEEPPCDLALLDVNLPGENGYSVCRKLKKQFNVPVIFLTARDTVEDELVGFGVGADDYIKKPYNATVLLARIVRLLKQERSVLSVRELTLDCSSLCIYYRGKDCLLTRTETVLLSCLMSGAVVAKDALIEQLWEKSCYLDENALYVNISRLRGKLKELGAEGYLQTVRGFGYRL